MGAVAHSSQSFHTGLPGIHHTRRRYSRDEVLEGYRLQHRKYTRLERPYNARGVVSREQLGPASNLFQDVYHSGGVTRVRGCDRIRYCKVAREEQGSG